MFFILPIGVDYRARRYPVVTFTLMGICAVVYLLTLILRMAKGPDVEIWVMENLWLTPSEPHWWAYLTSMFVHAGILHLAGNMVYLFLFGSPVEDSIGRVRFLFFYLGSGLVATLAHVALSSSSDLPLGGASGAISGCLGGFVLLLAKTRIEFKWLFVLWFRIWSGDFFLPAWLVISFWFLSDFVSMILNSDEHGGGVAFAAHVGGTLGGLAVMPLIKWWLKAHPEPDHDADASEEVPTEIHMRPRAPVRARVPLKPAAAEQATIHLSAAGVQSGPFTPSQIQEMFTNELITPDTFYWQQGMEDWRSSDELRPL